MTLLEQARQLIAKHEGLRLKPYRCTQGRLTIGYGRNLEQRGISEEEAEILLQNDLNNCRKKLEEHIDYYDDLPQTAQLVLLNMCYNLGISGLLSFQKTLLFLKEQRWQEASQEMLDSSWANQVGSRANRLSEMIASIPETPPSLSELAQEVKYLKRELAQLKTKSP